MPNLDPEAVFASMKQRVAEAVREQFPFDGAKRRLELVDITFDEKAATPDEPHHVDNIEEQLKSKLSGMTWGVQMRGHLRLVDKATGGVLGEKTITLARLPKLTRRYSYIIDGDERQHDSVFRSMPRPYHRISAGGEVQAQWNLSGGRGFEIGYDPKKGRAQMKIGDVHIPLYSVLHVLNVTDSAMETAWGHEVFTANVMVAKPERDVERIFSALNLRIQGKTSASVAEKAQRIRDYFDNETEVWPDAMKAALGKKYSNVNGEALLASSKRLLAIQQGRTKEDPPLHETPDDRQALSSKYLTTTEDFLVEAVRKHEGILRRQIADRIDKPEYRIDDILSPNVYKKVIMGPFEGAQRPEQTNPLQMLSGYMRTTIRGKDFGGVAGEQINLDPDKEINPTHIGFLDPIQTPECYTPEMEVFTEKGWRRWDTVTESTSFACRIGGRLEFHKADKIHASHYAGSLFTLLAGKIGYRVTPNHRIFSRPLGGSIWGIEHADEVHGKDRTFLCNHDAFIGTEGWQTFWLPLIEGNGSSKNIDEIEIEDWSAFVGWFLSEGSYTYDEQQSRYVVRISQSRTANPINHALIEDLLSRLPFAWCRTGSKGFAVYTKQIAHYCRQFGHSADKFIPEDLFNAPIAARMELLTALLAGDGRCDGTRARPVATDVYTTTSRQLATDVERLATTLGFSTTHKVYEDSRDPAYLPVHEVRLRKHTERSARTRHPRYPAQYGIEQYCGTVYCATVPGSLLYVRTPEGVGFWCGNSEDTGISLHLPLGITSTRAPVLPGMKSRVSSGQELRTKVYDLKTNKMEMVTAAEMEHAVVAYPDQVRWTNGVPHPVADAVVCYDEERRTSKRPWKSVRYVLPSAKALLSFSANMVPFLQNNNGNRAMMAAKQQEQAVPLVNREAPLVQVKTDGAPTFEQVMGTFVTHTAPIAGTVSKIEKDSIHIKTSAGTVKVPVYNHFPLNGGKGSMHATPVVAVGQVVKKGDLLADTNFSKDGRLAMGTNMRVAYIPWKGRNFEDGVIISESAAKKMASEHLHALDITIYPGMIGASQDTKARWADNSIPNRATTERLAKLDDRGVIKEGTVVHPGDVLVAALSPRQAKEEDKIAARIHKSLVPPYRDSALVWDHEYDGKVVRVTVTEALNRRRVQVHIATQEPMTIGDKVAGRHGNKGIISTILPDREMPYTKDGAIEMVLSPAGIPGRMNAGQMLETVASKIARKTGKPYIVENFVPGVDYTAKVLGELKKHNLSDTEELFDPATGKPVGQVMIGEQFMLKLHHQVEKKMTARSFGTAYTHQGEAPKGSGIPGGGQKMDAYATYAMLAHGSGSNLREAYTFKADGDQNAVWAAVITGRQLPVPQPTRGMVNFQQYLRALGVNVEKKGDQYTLMPLTDAHLVGDKERGIRGISNGAVRLPDKLVKARGVQTLEEMGGLFDPKVTGGLAGKFWSHVELSERVPNPLFESAIQVLTKMTKSQYNTLVSPMGHSGGQSGFQTIVEKLQAIDVDKELKKERARVGSLSRSELNACLKRIRYLETLKEHNINPVDAYTSKYLPVLPPNVRRVAIGLDGKQTVDDRNMLYLAVGMANASLKNMRASTPHEDRQKARAHLYDAIKALRVTGAASEITAGRPRHYQGLMELLSGKTDGSGAPKESLFQEGVLARRQDLSARSTIVPEPGLNLDEVGIPIPIAMEIYKPFVARELVRNGKTPDMAEKWVTQRADHPQTLAALERAVAARPLMLKRDPVLHKFGIQAFKPRLVGGKAIQIHPLVCAGFNADFDGNCVIGSSRLALTVLHDGATVQEALRRYSMKFSPTTKILARDPSSVTVEIDIQEFPRDEATWCLDKNGARVYAVPAGLRVWSYDHAAGAPGFFEVTGMTVEDKCRVARVTTRRGFEVTASDNESICAYDHGTQDIVKIAPSAALGRLVPIMKRVPVVRGTQADYEFGWMLGAYASDGFISGEQVVGYTKLSDAHRARFAAALTTHFGSTRQATYRQFNKGGGFNESAKDHFNVSKETVSFFRGFYVEREAGDDGRSALYKKLPSGAFSLSEETAFGILAGLLDGDGTVNKDKHGRAQFGFGTSSRFLRDDVLTLARLLGVRAGFSTTTPKAGRLQTHDAYTIFFSLPDMQAKLTRLDLTSPEKAQIVHELRGSDPVKDDRDIVPIPTGVLHTATAVSGPITDPGFFRSLSTIKSKSCPFYYCTRATARRVLSFFAADDSAVKRWRVLVEAEDAHWDIVDSAEPAGEETVYDLIVPATKVFAVNGGLVVYDTMSVFVPVSSAAVDEAHKMLPSQNLFSPTHYGVMNVPSQDAMLGIYQATKWGAEVKETGLTAERAMQMMLDGKLKAHDVVTIDGKKTTPGRLALAQALPSEMQHDERLLHDSSFLLNKGALTALLAQIGKAHPQAFPHVVDAWKDLGNKLAFMNGSSFSLHDFHDSVQFRDKVLAPFKAREAELHKTPMSRRKRDQEIVKLFEEARTELKRQGTARYDQLDNNRAWEWAQAGASKGWDQFSQMTIAPILVEDPAKRKVPVPITKSFGEGLSVSEYWTSLHGARKGTLDRARGTKEPGAVSKDIINTVMSISITAEDCGATDGVRLAPTNVDATDRFLAKAVKFPDGKEIPAGTLVTPAIVTELRNAHVAEVVVRSPMYCRMAKGICARCFGHSERGRLHAIGTNIGVIAGQSLGEPVTQLTMRCNAAGNLLCVRVAGKVRVMSFEQLWEALPAFVVCDADGVETKAVSDLEVWDQHAFVRAMSIQRHAPDDQMKFTRTANGFAFVSQGNHPNWVREAAPICPQCGSVEPVEFLSHWKPAVGRAAKTSVVCPVCCAPFTVERAEYEAQQERMACTNDLTGFLIGTSMYGEDSPEEMPLPPYLLGMFLAEGSIRRERKERENMDLGRQRRLRVPSGLRWKVHSAVITQSPGATRDRIIDELRTAGLPFFENGKNIEIASTRMGERLTSACAIGSENKRLPPGFLGQSTSWQMSFLAGLFDGNGTVKDDCVVIDSTSWTLASQTAALFRHLGGRVSLYVGTFRENGNAQPYKVFAYLPFALPSVKKHPVRPDLPERPLGYSEVVQVLSVAYRGLVYDICTESRAFSANGVRTHNTFHTGGASSGGVVDSFKRVKQLFTMPAILPDAATLAAVTGSVESVAKDPRGGFTIFISGKEHRVVAGQVLDSIKPGVQVHRGDVLSTGPTNPHELLKHTNSIDRVRNYLASEVEQAYSGMTRRRNIETVIRGMTNLTEVHDAPKESQYLRGELAPLSVVEAFNAEAEADGREKIKHAPKLRAMNQMPLSGVEDWLARLNYQRLKETFIEGAARGWSSNIHDHPIAGLAHGAEFGLHTPQPTAPPPKPGAQKK